MSEKVTKSEKKAVGDKGTVKFNRELFLSEYPVVTASGDNVPVWWKVVETPSMTYREYVKEKKRRERSAERLEGYKRALVAENERYSARLEKESELYQLERKARDEAYEARAKQFALEQEIEDAKQEKLYLEKLEEREAQRREAEKLREAEKERKQDEENVRIAELKRQEREAKAKIAREKLEAEERARLIEEESIKEAERRKEERRAQALDIKRLKIEQELKEAEEINAEKLRQAELEAKARLEEEERENAIIRMERERAEAEIEERKRIKAEHEKERERAEQEELRRRELHTVSEQKRIARLKKQHKIRDVAFQYPLPQPVLGTKEVLRCEGLSIKDKKSGEIVSRVFDFSISEGVNVFYDFNSCDIRDFERLITRELPKNTVLYGGINLLENQLHTLTKKDSESVLQNIYLMNYEDRPTGFISVGKLIEKRLGEESLDSAKAVLVRLGVRGVDKYLSKKMSALNLCDRTRVDLTCAILSRAKLIVLSEPQRYLDMPTRAELITLIKEWKNKHSGSALCIFTGDKGIVR